MVATRKTKYPHIEWVDINADGTMVECAIMKKDEEGNIFFLPLTALDDIDRSRLANIVTNRNANNFELWDLMSQQTLGNGINALNYFHQLVKILTPQGKVITPSASVMGASAQVTAPTVEAPAE